MKTRGLRYIVKEARLSLKKNKKTNFLYDKKLQEVKARDTIYCQNCGHSLLIGSQEKVICNWRGYYVFKDKKAEFKYRLKEQLLKK